MTGKERRRERTREELRLAFRQTSTALSLAVGILGGLVGRWPCQAATPPTVNTPPAAFLGTRPTPSGGATASFLPPGGSTVVIRVHEKEARPLFSVNDTVSILGGTVTFDAATVSYEVKLGGRTAVFGIESSMVVVDSRLVSLTVPVRGEGATVFADLEFFQKVLGLLFGGTFSWDRTTHTLSARKVETPEIRVEASVADLGTTSKVVLRFSESPSYKVEKGEGQVVFRIPSVRLVATTPEVSPGDPLVSRISIRPSEIAVFLKEKDLATNVYALASPPRLVVDVSRPSPAPVNGVPPVPPASPGLKSLPAVTSRAGSKVIVLDPGHGGTELGAQGPGSLLEKDATLALARAVRDTLQRRGYRVVTTRDSDVSVSLEERAAIANAAKADLFLSLHANASRSPAAHGTEVYYLSLDASDRLAAAVAEVENRLGGNPTPTPSSESNAALRDLELILWDLAQNQHLAASSRLAEIIQADFNRLLGVTTRGVKQAPFKVLIGVNAPAVLVEVAFITNPDEEKKLAADEFRTQVAETLAGSLESYFRSADAAAPAPPPSRGR